MSDEQAKEISAIAEFQRGELPVRYLGLPLITKKLAHADCLPLVDRVVVRIQTWRGKLPSYAGRLQLVKAVLTSFSIYWVAAFQLPMRTIYEVNRICRNFLWSGPDCLPSHSLLSWEDLLFPYDEVGLSIKDLATLNKAATMRHIWNIISRKRILWVQWVMQNLIKARDFWNLKVPARCSWSWCYILKGRKEAMFIARHVIGNGEGTRMWLDPWQHRGILRQYFPNTLLFHNDCNLQAKVCRLIQNGGWSIPGHMKR